MDCEQKYNAALERAKECLQDGTITTTTRDYIWEIFPELKWSKDEQIRKELIEHIKTNKEADYVLFKKFSPDDVIDWLEKQGQKSANIVPIPDGCHAYIKNRNIYIENYTKTMHNDKVEPKFHEGEWITNGDYTWKIVEVKRLYYILQSQDGNIVDDTISYVDEQFHSFTIEDAKDGDVLVTTKIKNCPFIYRKTSYKNNLAYYYVGINGDGNLDYAYPKNTLHHFGPASNVAPATKEQRDLLFQKMREAGYEWDSEKKELKKIEPKTLDPEKVIEWLKTHGNLVPVVTIKINEVIAKFKKDFGL